MKSYFLPLFSKCNVPTVLLALGITTASFPAMAAPQEACVRTSAGDVVCGIPVPKPSSATQTAEETIASQTQFGVTWDLKSCVRGAKNVVSCTVVLSPQTDGNISLYAAPYTKLVDASGGEYFAEKIQVGKKVDQKVVPFSMAQGASYRAVFSFSNVPSSVSQAVLFQISASGNVYTNFRNVPIN